MKELHQENLEVFHMNDYYKVKGLFVACFEEWNKKEPGYYFKVMSIFFQILERMSTSSTSKFSDLNYQKIKPAVDYIHAHFKEAERFCPLNLPQHPRRNRYTPKSSMHAPYRSLRPCGQSSLIPLLLLSPQSRLCGVPVYLLYNFFLRLLPG